MAAPLSPTMPAGIPDLGLPKADPACEHVYRLFVVRTRRRDAVAAGLAERGIATVVHYPCPPHRQPAFANAPLPVPLPVSEALAGEVLSLPMWPALPQSHIDRIADAVRDVLA